MAKTVERALLEMQEKAGMLRVFSDGMSVSREPEEPILYNGLGTVLGEIEVLARRVRRSLDVRTLDKPLVVRRRPPR